VPQPGEVMVGGRSRSLLWTSLVAVLLVAGGLAVVGRSADAPTAPAAARSPDHRAALDTAERFLSAWEQEDWQELQGLVADPSLDAAAVHAEAHRVLRVAQTRIEPGEPRLDADRAVVPFDLRWELDGLGDVAFASELPLVATPEGWRVRWWYPVVHPDLAPDRRFERVRVFPDRAPILAADGTPLVSTRPEVLVGVEPERVEDAEAVTSALVEHLGAEPDEVTGLISDPERTGFHGLGVMDVDSFEAARPSLEPITGIVFRRQSGRVAALPHGLASIVGSVGEVTAELLDELGPPYRPGDRVGRSGLERAHERQLAGDPEQEARIADAGGLITTLLFVDGTEPKPVQLTLDLAVQEAAAVALAGLEEPAALTAVDMDTGEVRAVVSHPDGDFPRALEGRYPPGSTFKVVTATAALRSDPSIDRIVDCPPELPFGDGPLRNAGGGGAGPIPLVQAMAVSCNTAFANLAAEVGREALAEAAGSFGFDAAYDAGVPSGGARFPLPESPAELAQAAIGQGRVEASPLHMATVAAAAATGTWRSPHLVAGGAVEERALPDGVQPALAALLRAAVEDGTGRAADRPGVHGKTGTAEFGAGEVLASHAWFIGWRHDLAFAVVVEGGGGGGAVAAPVAGHFLDLIDGTADPADGVDEVHDEGTEEI
jgi:cell division protein FtsI/penicillin-binding protein 2